MNRVHQIWRVCGPSARETFDEMRDQTPFLFPLLFVVVGTLILLAVFTFPIAYFLFEIMYIEFEQREGLITYTEKYFQIGNTRIDTLNGISLTPSVIVGLLFEAMKICFHVGVRLMLIGTYFYGISRWLGIDRRWEHWFGFSCWANIPMILVPSFVTTVGIYAITQPKAYLFLSVLWLVFFLLPLWWSVYVSVQGLRSWISKDTKFCVKVALVPYAVIILLWSPAIWVSFFHNPFDSILG
ncbi:MAG: hypothetical protein F4W92_02930 [Gammaproteobacteria bacterium]|nr:hypothetical protein [Gammaproteobacteria bacterium]